VVLESAQNFEAAAGLSTVALHIAAWSVAAVGEELAVHRDLDAVAFGVGAALHLHFEVDGAHDAVAEFFVDQFFEG
jgi:hypothetical protein